MAAILRDSVAVVVVVVRACARTRAKPLAMATRRKSIGGFPLFFLYGYGARLGGPAELRDEILFSMDVHFRANQIFVAKGTEEDLCMDWEENVNDACTSRKHAPFSVSVTVFSNNIS